MMFGAKYWGVVVTAVAAAIGISFGRNWRSGTAGGPSSIQQFSGVCLFFMAHSVILTTKSMAAEGTLKFTIASVDYIMAF